MVRNTIAILFSIMIVAFSLAGACAPAFAAELPPPPDKWWETLSPGDAATYEVVINTEPATKTTMTYKIIKIKGSKITYSTIESTEGVPSYEQTETVDVDVKNISDLPMDAALTKLGEKVFKVGGQSFKCTEYRVKTYNSTANLCHSPELPIIFNYGYVVMETESGSFTSTITLKEFTGKKMDTK